MSIVAGAKTEKRGHAAEKLEGLNRAEPGVLAILGAVGRHGLLWYFTATVAKGHMT